MATFGHFARKTGVSEAAHRAGASHMVRAGQLAERAVEAVCGMGIWARTVDHQVAAFDALINHQSSALAAATPAFQR
jgi:hypothetical protein